MRIWKSNSSGNSVTFSSCHSGAVTRDRRAGGQETTFMRLPSLMALMCMLQIIVFVNAWLPEVLMRSCHLWKCVYSFFLLYFMLISTNLSLLKIWIYICIFYLSFIKPRESVKQVNMYLKYHSYFQQYFVSSKCGVVKDIWYPCGVSLSLRGVVMAYYWKIMSFIRWIKTCLSFTASVHARDDLRNGKQTVRRGFQIFTYQVFDAIESWSKSETSLIRHL